MGNAKRVAMQPGDLLIVDMIGAAFTLAAQSAVYPETREGVRLLGYSYRRTVQIPNRRHTLTLGSVGIAWRARGTLGKRRITVKGCLLIEKDDLSFLGWSPRATWCNIDGLVRRRYGRTWWIFWEGVEYPVNVGF